MENRGNKDKPVKGVCECSDKKDESSSGVCGNSQTINSITVTSTAFGIAEVSIAFLIAVVNKKIYLLVKFIDTC